MPLLDGGGRRADLLTLGRGLAVGVTRFAGATMATTIMAMVSYCRRRLSRANSDSVGVSQPGSSEEMGVSAHCRRPWADGSTCRRPGRAFVR